MQSKAFLKYVSLASVIGLSGCAVPSASDIFSSAPQKDYSNMYLRGVFNWWEANEQFKFAPISEDLFVVEIELIADGQPYDFKVADDTWSPAYNCGLALSADALSMNDPIELYCYTDSLNLQFIPSETAIYRFELDVSNQQYPELTIQRSVR
jgi:hypothetical protein